MHYESNLENGDSFFYILYSSLKNALFLLNFVLHLLIFPCIILLSSSKDGRLLIKRFFMLDEVTDIVLH